jgi:hypothetical protein
MNGVHYVQIEITWNPGRTSNAGNTSQVFPNTQSIDGPNGRHLDDTVAASGAKQRG